MRLWSLSPEYLDRQGLLALWREGLLAQKVLQGKTKGYRNHPQLERFRESGRPLDAIGFFLLQVWAEAERRGYSFERGKILRADGNIGKIEVTKGQIEYEWELLRIKLARRDKQRCVEMGRVRAPATNALFELVEGDVMPWERQKTEVVERL